MIADDHAVVRTGVVLLCNAQPDMEVVAEAANGNEAMRCVGEVDPDVLVLDLSMPGINAIQLIDRLRTECSRTRVLVLSAHDEPSYMRSVFASGGAGYVTKMETPHELLEAIRTVSQGRFYIDPSLSESLAGSTIGNGFGNEKSGLAMLSTREREVLELLASGLTNQGCADRLYLSVKTIETHRARIGTKLNLTSRADLVRYALESGLLRPTNANEPV